MQKSITVTIAVSFQKICKQVFMYPSLFSYLRRFYILLVLASYGFKLVNIVASGLKYSLLTQTNVTPL